MSITDVKEKTNVKKSKIMKSRSFTKKEVKEQFLDHVRELVHYWDKESSKQTQTERLSGLAFSILAAIDGASISLPAFILAPQPHPEDRKYAIEQGKNYYPQNQRLKVKSDISGDLHESFYK